MGAFVRKTAQLGEVIVTAYDKAAQYSSDPKVVSRLATHAVALMLLGLGGGRHRPRVVAL
jgi:hypothetical protein